MSNASNLCLKKPETKSENSCLLAYATAVKDESASYTPSQAKLKITNFHPHFLSYFLCSQEKV